MFHYYHATSRDGRLRVAAVSGQVWLLEKYKQACSGSGATMCRHLLGDYELDSPNVPMTAQLTANGFLFTGIVKCSRRSLRIWHVRDSLPEDSGPGSVIGEVALKTTKEAKFRGFGAAKMLGGSEKVVTFRVICGVGIGKAHVWSMDIDSSCNTVVKEKYEGGCAAKLPTISALALCGETAGTLVTVTYLHCIIQKWDLEGLLAGRSADKPFQASGGAAQTLSPEEAIALLGEQAFAELMAQHDLYSRGRPITMLSKLAETVDFEGILPFPLKTLLEDQQMLINMDTSEELNYAGRYLGELNDAGEPTGSGILCLGDVTYEGEFRGGLRSGSGKLVDVDTGRVVYDGGWLQNEFHGSGVHVTKDEEYRGQFIAGKRHGFGELKVLRKVVVSVGAKRKRGQESTRPKGESFVGFWDNDKMCGIGRWTYSGNGLADACSRLACYGDISSYVVCRKGTIMGEFYFHRTDGTPLTADDEIILNELLFEHTCLMPSTEFRYAPERLNASYAFLGCWRCTKSNVDCPLLGCPSCGFMLHQSCCEGQPVCHVHQTELQRPNCEPHVKLDQLITTMNRELKKSRNSSSSRQMQENKTTAVNPEQRGRKSKAKPKTQPRKSKVAQEASRLAQALGQSLCDPFIEARAREFKDVLHKQRLEEIRNRKSWKETKEQKQKEVTSLELELRAAQSLRARKQLKAQRLQGQGVEHMNLSDLTELQNSIEETLQLCRQRLEQLTQS